MVSCMHLWTYNCIEWSEPNLLYDCVIALGSTVEVFTDDDKTFTGLFFQDSLMKATFGVYPEVLMIDATYKLSELRLPLYLMFIVDSNGQSEIVGVFLKVIETQEAITRMVHGCF